jgi:beta-lactam-binding protein with PASTA domain
MTDHTARMHFVHHVRRHAAVAAVLMTASALLTTASLSACRPPWAHTVQAPTATGLYPDQAVTAVEAAGLRVRFRAVPALEEANANTNGYSVTAQEPAAGTQLAPGDTVTLTLTPSVNAGDEPVTPAAGVTVPSVVGLDPNAAVRRLTRLGLVVDIPATGPRTVLEVTAQAPSPGTRTTQGSHVRLSL